MNVAIFIQGLATVSWLAAIVVIIFAVLGASRGRPLRGGTSIVLGIVIVAALFSSAATSVIFIQPEERGVVISALAPKGYREQALEPGLRWVIPFFENVIRYPISRQTYTMSKTTTEGNIQGDDSISARTSDGQEVFIDASVIFQIDPTQVTRVHIEWQDRYIDGLVRPMARGIIRDVISQYGVEQVVTSKRDEISQTITSLMEAKLKENGLMLLDFLLRNITFSTEYSASIEQKQIAEQQAQQAKLVVEQKIQEAEQARQTAQGAADAVVIRAKGDADARLIQAEAEAKALALIATAIQNNPQLIQYLYVNKLSPSIQTMLVPANSPYLLPLPTQAAPAVSATPEPTLAPSPTAAPTATPTTTNP